MEMRDLDKKSRALYRARAEPLPMAPSVKRSDARASEEGRLDARRRGYEQERTYPAARSLTDQERATMEAAMAQMGLLEYLMSGKGDPLWSKQNAYAHRAFPGVVEGYKKYVKADPDFTAAAMQIDALVQQTAKAVQGSRLSDKDIEIFQKQLPWHSMTKNQAHTMMRERLADMSRMLLRVGNAATGSGVPRSAIVGPDGATGNSTDKFWRAAKHAGVEENPYAPPLITDSEARISRRIEEEGDSWRPRESPPDEREADINTSEYINRYKRFLEMSAGDASRAR